VGILTSVQSRAPRDECLPLTRRFDVLGSVRTAVYSTELRDGAPSELAGGALELARDGLGGAVEAAGPLPARVAAELIEAAEARSSSGSRRPPRSVRRR
jgi:hypothetical protein